MDYVLIGKDLFKKNDKRRRTKLTLDVLNGHSIEKLELKNNNLYISVYDDKTPELSVESYAEENVGENSETIESKSQKSPKIPDNNSLAQPLQKTTQKFARGPMQFIDSGEFRNNKDKKLYNEPVERTRPAAKINSYTCSICGEKEETSLFVASDVPYRCNGCIGGKKK